jgi:hypothetical protein
MTFKQSNRDQEDCGLRLAQAKNVDTLYEK